MWMADGEVWCRMTVYASDGTALGGCVLAGSGQPTLAAVNQLARLSLAARWLGGSAALWDAAPGLGDVFELAGLGELYRQMWRESEVREHARHGALERVEPADPPAGDLEDL